MGQGAAGGRGEPDGSAVRVALWRALHVRVDAPPHVLVDEVGLELAAPGDGWEDRADMDLRWTAGNRAGMVARARFVEDLVAEEAARGVGQYVILGAGLDTFAQRRPELAARMRVFEIDQPDTQAWKRRRLDELGYGVPDWLRFVPVDFEAEAGVDWWQRLGEAGFEADRPAVFVSTGVAMYLSKETTVGDLRRMAGMAPGSTVLMTFMVPFDLLDAASRATLEVMERKAREAGTPFVSYFRPGEMVALAREAGFREVRHLAGTTALGQYFTGRADGLRPAAGEDLLVARV
ncbi:class I SAM-dependent methyltransferase [Streptomyces sp. NPDC093085]|uniref:class I SAM-dependent methyltransferase n=1 Tax=Streptomyces sp. NPDC093085 TaxID=3155068 RepID=UPI003435F178